MVSLQFASVLCCSLASKFLVEGFRHCSVKDAVRLKEPAEKLLITAIQDSSHFVMDYLLELQPIKALHGTVLFNVSYTNMCVCNSFYI